MSLQGFVESSFTDQGVKRAVYRWTWSIVPVIRRTTPSNVSWRDFASAC